MEEVLLQLWAEVARLQELCSEQGRLLQSLRARKGPVPDTPELLPIQCTEDAVTGDGRRSPGSRQKHPGAPTSCASHPGGSAHPEEQPRGTNSFPPSPGSGGAAALGSTPGEQGDVPAWMGTWTLPGPWEGGDAPRSPRELEAPSPGAGGSFPNPPDLYQAPKGTEKEDAPRDVVLPGEALVEIRGPVKMSWTPGWALEEELGTCEAAPAWDLCQELLPWMQQHTRNI